MSLIVSESYQQHTIEAMSILRKAKPSSGSVGARRQFIQPSTIGHDAKHVPPVRVQRFVRICAHLHQHSFCFRFCLASAASLASFSSLIFFVIASIRSSLGSDLMYSWASGSSRL